MASKLYQTSVKVSDIISVRVPTVGQIIDDEDNFNQLVLTLVATPYDIKCATARV